MDEERRLWERLANRESAGPAAACPDPDILAAYADGRAPRGEIATVETHLLHCDDCLDALKLLRSRETEPLADVSALILARAKSLVAPDNVVRLPQRRFIFLGRTAAWAALAASLVIACVGGYRLGEGVVVEAGMLHSETGRFLDPLENDLVKIP